MARLNYLELPVADTARAKAFYAAAFGWAFSDFGPTYAATTTGDTDVGFQADAEQMTAAGLPVIEVQDIDAALAIAARIPGARVGSIEVRPIYMYNN